MAGLDDLSRGELPDIFRRLRALETAAPLQNASIGAGGLRVYGGGVITIQDGGLSVTGTATIIGTLIASGVLTLTGTLTQSGPSTFTGDTSLNGPTHINGATDITGAAVVTGDMRVEGPTHLNGITDIAGNTTVTGDFTTNGPMKTTGTLSVEGITTLKNDLNVTTGGRVVAGNTTITPSASNGGIEFVSGGGVGGNGGSVVVKGTGNAGLISSPTTTSMFSGSSSVDVEASGTTVNGSLKVTGITSTASAANVYYDTVSKQLYYKP